MYVYEVSTLIIQGKHRVMLCIICVVTIIILGVTQERYMLYPVYA